MARKGCPKSRVDGDVKPPGDAGGFGRHRRERLIAGLQPRWGVSSLQSGHRQELWWKLKRRWEYHRDTFFYCPFKQWLVPTCLNRARRMIISKEVGKWILIIFLKAFGNNIPEIFILFLGHTPRIFHNKEGDTTTFAKYILCMMTNLPKLLSRKRWKYKLINTRKVELIK